MTKSRQTETGTGLEIAVIGITGRFPAAKNIHEFWENLKKGKESISFFSHEELEKAGVTPGIINDPGYVKAGVMLEEKEYFDASFFGYNPVEAEVTDPQVRIFHECCWHALEEAGYDPAAYHRLIGLYAGASSDFEWEAMCLLSGKTSILGQFATSLLRKDFLCTTVSYKLGLKGPSVFVQTACSTSLVAIHMACQGLLSGECDMALAGGVTLVSFQNVGYSYQEGMIGSPDGHCRTFDAKTAGTIGGEGIGMVVLKRLNDAVKDRDYIYAVIKGSAINNDGNRKVGFTAPSIKGQAEAVRAALQMAEVEPESISYIEAHGTGTTLGDPVEIRALKKVFKTNKKNSCKIGSVKTNVGHLNSAAGVAGFIKTVLALKHQLIPPSLHFEYPNPEIDFENSPFYVNTKPTPWKNEKYPRRAGVSSFGIGGTNAHVILEEWARQHHPLSKGEENMMVRPDHLILLSARTQTALDRMTYNLAEYLKKNPNINLADAAYSLQVGRGMFPYRRMLVCSTIDEAIDTLSSPSPGKVRTNILKQEKTPVIFMFSGLGAQYVNMGLEIYQTEPVFHREMDRCFKIIRDITGNNIREILYPGESQGKARPMQISPGINQFHIAQLVVFILQYALAKLLIHWGIKPYAMIGYSFGEYAAACISGVFSLEDALKLIVFRGESIKKIPPGVMLSVPLTRQQLKPLLDPHNELSLAIDNGASCIVAGPGDAVDTFEQKMKKNGYMSMRLQTSFPLHSTMMAPILKEFEETVRQVVLNKPQIPYISNVTGDWITVGEATSPGYWAKHLKETVRFADGIEKLIEGETEKAVFIELGPEKDLSTLVMRQLDNNPSQRAINIIRQHNKKVTDVFFLLNRIGSAWLLGVEIDWNMFNENEKRYRIPLPTYSFERTPYPASGNFYQMAARISSDQALSLDDTVLFNETKISPAEIEEKVSTPDKMHRFNLSTGYTAPGDEVEQAIVEIFQQFFGIKPIGVDDEFYELGGDSLKATILTSKIHKELKVKVPLAEVLKRQTIRSLGEYISLTGVSTTKYFDIEPVETREYYALSSAQKRMYFLQQMDLSSTSYNMPMVLPLGKDVDKGKLELILEKLVARHESLRTFFQRVNETPVQRIHRPQAIKPLFDYIEVDETRVQEAIKNYIKPFDLSKAPLIRSGIIKLPDGHFTWLVDMHHIITDGTSHTVLQENFISLYNQRELEPLKLQYKDFSQWQNRMFESGEIKSQEYYWLSIYSHREEIPWLNIPADYKRPGVFTFEGDHYRFSLEREDVSALNSLGVRYGATLYMNLLAILNTLFFRYTGQTDIIIGSGIAGRAHADLQQIVGMFVNNVAMRSYPEGEKTYESFLKEVIPSSIKAFENQDLQFEELVDKLDLKRDPSRNPLFDVSLVLQNFRTLGEGGPGGENSNVAEVLPTTGENSQTATYSNLTTKMDLTFFVMKNEEDIHLSIEYYTAIFKEETIRRLAGHFKNIVKAVIQAPQIKLKDIQVITAKEKQQVLYSFNETGKDYPKHKTILNSFEEQAARTPGNVAVILKDEQLTYKELDEQSNRLCRYLYDLKRIKCDSRVGISMEPNLNLVVAIFGVLKSGGAYVPLETSLPEKRKKQVITDSDIGVVISEKKNIRELNRLQWECGCLHSYLCMDSDDVHEEEELEKSELMNRELWEHVGQNAVDDITGGGWVSSYTGEPMSEAEMDEYGDNILKKLEPLLHLGMRVLEIGCASGFSMYRVAPRVGFYYGTDLSGVIIERNKTRIRQEGHNNIKLSRLAAHEIDKSGEDNFDLVIINSVIQAFHGHNYLRQVIGKSIDLLGEKGYLFLGDIMDLEKKELLIHELEAFKKVNRGKNYTTKTDFSRELFLSRGFWQDLCVEWNEIQEVEFTDKRYTIENELTKFRYDTLLKINKKRTWTKGYKKKGCKKKKQQDDLRILSRFSGKSPGFPIPSDSLAYVVYTSGSTGVPKGVCVEHKGLFNFINWRLKNYQYSQRDVTLQLLSFGFDGFCSNFYSSLLCGGKLVLVGKDELLDYNYIVNAAAANNVTNMTMVPPMYEVLLEHSEVGKLHNLRFVVLAGEKANSDLIGRSKKTYPGILLCNEYGPTEGSVGSTAKMEMNENNPGLIGHPIWNVCVYIFDSGFHFQPVGVAGELCIRGNGTARGYLNRPELTAEKFLTVGQTGLLTDWSLSYGVQPPPSLYRTGDLGKWLPDGNIEFLGRIDHQVKIRGFRVELGEIESHLSRHGLVREAVVTDRAGPNEEKYLCGYITCRESFDLQELKEYLSRSLPDYMVPAHFIQLEKIPLTSNGKIDREKLPVAGVTGGCDCSGPRDELEEKLVEIWADVLNVDSEKISIDSNFFELGGHSLKATTLASKIHKELKVKVPLAEIFKSSTIRALAEYIKETREATYAGIQSSEKKSYYELSYNQKRLWIIHQMDPNSTAYNINGIIPLNHEVNIGVVETTISKIFARHESLRTGFIEINGETFQFIREHVDINIPVEDVSGLKDNEKKIKTGEIVAETNNKPFDLGTPPLFRAALVKQDKESFVFVYNMHHIITDGWSMVMLGNDFQHIYESLSGGKEPDIPSFALQYRDFAAWNNRQIQVPGYKEKVHSHWRKKLQTQASVLKLPYSYSGSHTDKSGAAFIYVMNQEIKHRLIRLSQENQTTLFMVMFAMYQLLLAYICGQEEVFSVVISAGRQHALLHPIIGYFVNPLIIKTKVSLDGNFDDLLKNITSDVLESFQYQDYPFELAAEALDFSPPNASTCFNMFNIQDALTRIELDSFESYHNASIQDVKFDITLLITEYKNGIEMRWNYRKSLFTPGTIENIALSYIELMDEVTDTKDNTGEK